MSHSLRNPLQGISHQLLWECCITFLWGDWNAHSAMDSKVSFQRVSLTQATAVDARRQRASNYVVAALGFNLCVCVRPHDLLPLAIAQEMLAKLLSRLGATEPGTGAQLPMLLQWPFQSLKEEGLGVCRPFQKYAPEGTF